MNWWDRTEKNYDNLYSSGSKPAILYRIGKIHKALEDGIATIRPILSPIGTPTYKLEYTVKDSFPFAKEVEEFDPGLIMATSDVKSVFSRTFLQKLLAFMSIIFIESKRLLIIYEKKFFITY